MPRHETLSGPTRTVQCPIHTEQQICLSSFLFGIQAEDKITREDQDLICLSGAMVPYVHLSESKADLIPLTEDNNTDTCLFSSECCDTDFTWIRY